MHPGPHDTATPRWTDAHMPRGERDARTAAGLYLSKKGSTIAVEQYPVHVWTGFFLNGTPVLNTVLNKYLG